MDIRPADCGFMDLDEHLSDLRHRGFHLLKGEALVRRLLDECAHIGWNHTISSEMQMQIC
ncbi:hypothetical protein SDC9_85041 [bioreactor metagenome]|uniref:Uncharacterized protein n=1 Tax=bioreactor metagenome TaxID=1076179 RepID=A0A644ZBZ4_9ZZZZ